MNAQGAPVALGENLEITARLRRFDDAEGVALAGHGQIDGIIAGELQKHAGVGAALIGLAGGVQESRTESETCGHALLVADPFTLCLLDAEGAGLLPKLKPLASIGGGLSYALVVREDSPLKDWASLTAAAGGPSLLAMANNDRMSAYLSAKDLMQKRAGLIFQPFVAGSAQAILDRVLTQQCDLGTIDTRLALLHNEKAAPKGKVRVLVTFGALRAPELPDVLTFAEIVGDPKAAYTTSVAVFCSPSADATFASTATAALLSIADNEAMRQEARQLRFPLRIEGPESVQATIARDRRVIRDLYS